jgi:hypothetical protein
MDWSYLRLERLQRPNRQALCVIVDLSLLCMTAFELVYFTDFFHALLRARSDGQEPSLLMMYQINADEMPPAKIVTIPSLVVTKSKIKPAMSSFRLAAMFRCRQFGLIEKGAFTPVFGMSAPSALSPEVAAFT